MRYLLSIVLLLVGSLQICLAQCDVDCVWPGDFNANGIANNLDILAFGFSLDETGPARASMTTDWEGLDADEWADVLPTLGVNFKHSDANGNGIVEYEDRQVVSINYNRTNEFFTGLLGDAILGEDLFLVPQNEVTTPSGSFIVDIHLGSASNPIDSIYGIGFQLKVDSQYVESVNFDFTESWIGTGDEILTYEKYSDEIEHIATTITRHDGISVSGAGKIAQVEIVITDVVLGLVSDTTACLPFYLEFENVLGINENGENKMITIQHDSLTLKHSSQLTNIEEVWGTEIKVFPNPVTNELFIQQSAHSIESIRLINNFGQTILHHKYQQSLLGDTSINVNDIPKGIYFIQISGQTGITSRKIIIH